MWHDSASGQVRASCLDLTGCIAIDARRAMVQLTILLLMNPSGYTVVHSELVHVSMLIAFLTDLASRTPLVALSTAQYPSAPV